MYVCMTDGVGYFILLFPPLSKRQPVSKTEKKPGLSDEEHTAFLLCVKRYTHNKFPLNNKI